MTKLWLLLTLLTAIGLCYLYFPLDSQLSKQGRLGLLLAGAFVVITTWGLYLKVGASQGLEQRQRNSAIIEKAQQALMHPEQFAEQLGQYLNNHPDDCTARTLLYKLLVSQGHLKQATQLRSAGKPHRCLIKPARLLGHKPEMPRPKSH